MRKAENLIHTSVEDCRVSLFYWGAEDLPELERALQMACDYNHKTRAGLIGSKVRELKREVRG